MGLVMKGIGIACLGTSLLAGCASMDPYAPALRARPGQGYPLPWDNERSFLKDNPPPEDLLYKRVSLPPTPAMRFAPSSADLATWEEVVRPERVCSGKGKKRRCRMVTRTRAETAEGFPVAKPSGVQRLDGKVAEIIYDFRPGYVYQIVTSPAEFTRLVFPEGERKADRLRLNLDQWEVLYGKTIDEGVRHELVALRPLYVGLKARDIALFHSGVKLTLRFVSQEQPDAMVISWQMPAPTVPKPVPVALDKQPPKFDRDTAYADYTITLEGKQVIRPAWMPSVILDDGRNTLIFLEDSVEGQRMPVVAGLLQNGKEAIIPTRLFNYTSGQGKGSVIYVGGLHPAFRLRDAGGATVKVVRLVPPHIVGQVAPGLH